MVGSPEAVGSAGVGGAIAVTAVGIGAVVNGMETFGALVAVVVNVMGWRVVVGVDAGVVAMVVGADEDPGVDGVSAGVVADVTFLVVIGVGAGGDDRESKGGGKQGE